MSGTITIVQALQITGICMGIVFVTLFFISLLIDFLKVLLTSEFGKKSEDENTTVTGNQALGSVASSVNGKKPEELTTEDEIAVALVAAIEASEDNKDAKVKVLAVREVG